MAGGLSESLIDEAAQSLTSVVRLTLPAERWPAVGDAVNRMDDAVWAGDEGAVRAELKNLRGAVIGTAPRARPGEGLAPAINPLSYRTTDYVTRTPIRWIVAILVVGAGVLASLIVALLVVLAVGADDGPAPGTPPATSVPPQMSPAPPGPVESSGGGGGVYLVTLGVVMLLGIGFFALMIARRRARAGHAQDTSPSVPRARLAERVPPPDDVGAAVDRVLMVLAARRDES